MVSDNKMSEEKNEVEVFKRLRGITHTEALAIHREIYDKLIDERGASDGIPIRLLRERCDIALAPYGWTYDRLFTWSASKLQ